MTSRSQTRARLPSGFGRVAHSGMIAAAFLAGPFILTATAQDGWDPVVVSPTPASPIRSYSSPTPAPTPSAKPERKAAAPAAAAPAAPVQAAAPDAKPPAVSPGPVDVKPPPAPPQTLKLDATPVQDPVPEVATQPQPSAEPDAKKVTRAEPAPEPLAERAEKPAEAPAAEPTLAQQYCVSIADAAADARFAWQKKTISAVEQELEKRISALEAKTAEYQSWLARRDEFAKKADETLVRIYARMRPDAAAQQLAAIDEETAAAVLVKLDPRNSSIILNEMEATHAARLTSIISGAGKVTAKGASGRKPNAPTGDKRS